MSQALRHQPAATIEEFDKFVESQRDDSLWELIDGAIVAMINPTIAHEIIAGNIGAPLNLALRNGHCRAYQGGIRVQRDDDRRGTYKPRPDILVDCGTLDLRRTYVTNPLVVVEILSPSTMDNDRGLKLAFYKTIQGLRHIVLVYQDQCRIEHYRREVTGWEIEVLTNPTDTLSFDALGFSLAISEVYRGIA